MSQYHNNHSPRPTGARYGMGARTHKPSNTLSASRTTSPTTAATSRRISVSPAASTVHTRHSYGGTRNYSTQHRPSSYKRWIAPIFIISIIFVVIGCAFLFVNHDASSSPTTTTSNLVPTPSLATAPMTTSLDMPESPSTLIVKSTQQPSPEFTYASNLEPQVEPYHVYDPKQLSPEEKELFAILYDGIAIAKPTIFVPLYKFSPSQLERVLITLHNDCPELVHFNREVSVSYSMLSDYITSVTFTYTYSNSENDPYHNSGLYVRFLDVDDADAAIVNCDGHIMLIDGGTTKSGSSKLYSYLSNNRISYVDAVVVSHPHSDHAGGLCGALAYEDCRFGALYSPVLSSDNKSFTMLLEQAEQRGLHPIVPDIGTQFSLGNAQVTFLSPEAHKSYENVNNKSLVVRIDYGNVSFLFTGDAMESAELDMLSKGVDLDVDVLKVAHHGANTSSSLDFLNAVSPSLAVISCGKDDKNHPGTETLSRLQQTAGLVLRTDENGEITVFTDGDQLTYLTEK